jgi:hypothetical protein
MWSNPTGFELPLVPAVPEGSSLNNRKHRESIGKTAVYMTVGVAIGISLGVALQNMGAGLAIGIAIGVAISANRLSH